MMTPLKRIIHYGWVNFWRQSGLSLASIFIMVLTISLISSLFLLRGGSQFLITSLEEKVDMSVYFTEETMENEILQVRDTLAQLPEVKNIDYVSREEALQHFTERHEGEQTIMESLQEIGVNPLLASLNIRAWEAAQYQSIVDFLDGSSFGSLISKVDYSQKKPAMERFSSIVSMIKRVGIASSIVFAIVAILVAFNTVRLAIYNSREEIETMRLVGAANSFIRGPFLVEGIIVGVFATLVSLVLFILVLFFLSPKIEIVIPGFDLFNYFWSNFFLILLIQLLTGVGLGILSSFIAIRRYLRV